MDSQRMSLWEFWLLMEITLMINFIYSSLMSLYILVSMLRQCKWRSFLRSFNVKREFSVTDKAVNFTEYAKFTSEEARGNTL